MVWHKMCRKLKKNTPNFLHRAELYILFEIVAKTSNVNATVSWYLQKKPRATNLSFKISNYIHEYIYRIKFLKKYKCHVCGFVSIHVYLCVCVCVCVHMHVVLYSSEGFSFVLSISQYFHLNACFDFSSGTKWNAFPLHY